MNTYIYLYIHVYTCINTLYHGLGTNPSPKLIVFLEILRTALDAPPPPSFLENYIVLFSEILVVS